MKRKDHASFCSEIDSISLSPSKERTSIGDSKSARKFKASKGESEREKQGNQ
jgi:hypothetical protein